MQRVKFTVKDEKGRIHVAHTTVPDMRPNPGMKSKHFRNIKAEFQARYLSGRNTGSAVKSDRKFQTAMNQFNRCMSMQGITSGDYIKLKHVKEFVKAMVEGKSFATGSTGIGHKAAKDYLGQVRKILTCYGRGHMLKDSYRALGLKVAHSDREKPMTFTADREARRDAFQEKLYSRQARCYWQAVVSETGRAFGMRTAERVESRDILIKNIDGTYQATKGAGKLEIVSEKALLQRYGRSFINRLNVMETGVQHLIVEHAKGARNRVQPINTPARVEAVRKLHDLINNSPSHSKFRKPYPDATREERGTERAEKAYETAMGRLGGTREAQLNAYADRHAEAQRMWRYLRASGVSFKQASQIITRDLGHDDPRKINYYINRA